MGLKQTHDWGLRALAVVAVAGILGTLGIGGASPAGAFAPTGWTGVLDPRVDVGGTFLGEIDLEVCGESLVAVGRGTNNSPYVSSTTDGYNWSTWKKLPGAFNSPPILAPLTSVGGCHMFGVGTNNSPYAGILVPDDAGPTFEIQGGWTKLPGAMRETPSILLAFDESFELVGRGTNNAIYMMTFDEFSGFSNWFGLGGAASHRPHISLGLNDQECIDVAGTNNAMYTECTTESGLTGWMNRGGNFAGAPGSSLIYDEGGSQIGRATAARASDGSVRVDTGSGFKSLGGASTPDAPTISQFELSDESLSPLQVGVLGTDGRDWTRTSNNGLTSWSAWSKWTSLELPSAFSFSGPTVNREAATTESPFNSSVERSTEETITFGEVLGG